MLERERTLGLRTEDNPSGLIYPVKFFDGEHFPADARRMQLRDLSSWNYPVPAFCHTLAFVEFIAEVQKVSRELAEMISHAPPWQRDWPVLQLNQTAPTNISLPRVR